MQQVEVRRTFRQSPADVWPVVTDPDQWLEPGVRWQIDERASEPSTRFVGRFWSTPSESTEVTITLEPTDDGGTEVTVVETRDRQVDLGPAAADPRAQLVGAP